MTENRGPAQRPRQFSRHAPYTLRLDTARAIGSRVKDLRNSICDINSTRLLRLEGDKRRMRDPQTSFTSGNLLEVVC